MSKARYTSKGKVKVTMTVVEALALNAILWGINGIGDARDATAGVSNALDALGLAGNYSTRVTAREGLWLDVN